MFPKLGQKINIALSFPATMLDYPTTMAPFVDVKDEAVEEP